MANRAVSPWRVVLALVLVGGILLGVSLIPGDGKIQITENFAVKFPRAEKMFLADTLPMVDLKAIREKEIADSIALAESLKMEDSLTVLRSTYRNQAAAILFPDETDTVLFPLFRKLDNPEQFVRILHYGDSQIETDRMTNVIREGLQEKFGGGGAGLQPAIQMIPSGTIRQQNSGNFRRYAVWDYKSEKPVHNRFGPLLNFAEVTGAYARVTFTHGYNATTFTKKTKRLEILLGEISHPLGICVVNRDTVFLDTIWPGNGLFQTISVNLKAGSEEVAIHFSQNPEGRFELYGFGLEGDRGVAMDNLPMRGCSGTVFTKLEKSHYFKSLKDIRTAALFLQFGGNAVPSIQSRAHAGRFAREFERQIQLFREFNPGIPILVIGPSDMSTRIDGEYRPYPYLSAVRDSLKAAAFRQECAYFDMIEAMGGLNAMPAWVNASPALAGGDYIHFTPAGAKKMGRMLMHSLLREYEIFKLSENQDYAKP